MIIINIKINFITININKYIKIEFIGNCKKCHNINTHLLMLT